MRERHEPLLVWGSSDDLPAEVAVVGELLAIDGTVLTGIATETINTFETGPRLVLARLDPVGAQCGSRPPSRL